MILFCNLVCVCVNVHDICEDSLGAVRSRFHG